MRTTHVWVAALVVGALAAPVHAELKYTMRIDARPSAAPASASANTVIAALMAGAVNAMAPAGGLEMTVTVGERGTRVDYTRNYLVVPAGGSTIVHPDGSLIAIDPTTKTYWRMAKPTLPGMGAAPAVSVTRTGEVSTIAGTRAERATIEIRMPLPAAAVAAMPGLPADVVLTGEAWFSDQFRAYARLAQGLMGANAFGFDALASEGFVVRSILRGDLLGGREVESVVTSLSESTAPAGWFEAPSGFTEVPPPARLPR